MRFNVVYTIPDNMYIGSHRNTSVHLDSTRMMQAFGMIYTLHDFIPSPTVKPSLQYTPVMQCSALRRT